ncbi:MAG: DNA-3-methyladenine glycosylase [Cyclobacteriaceae bacterium]
MGFEINTSEYVKLNRSFYEREDVVLVAKELLGKYLITNLNNILTIGKIVETEAYCGRNDKACHAHNKRTPRTEIMYGRGGHAWVYLCYGIHHLFNVVTNREGLADAVLIRAIEPVFGLEDMKQRRSFTSAKLTSGPGTLSQAMGICAHMTGYDLLKDKIWIADGHNKNFEIETDVRIGVDYAGKDAMKPWRFFIKNNLNVSRNKKARED